jgi:hypothetical protein
LRSETLTQNAPGTQNSSGSDRVQFDISLVYVPQAATEQTSTDKSLPAADGDKARKQVSGEEKGQAVPLRPARTANAKAAAGGKGVAR